MLLQLKNIEKKYPLPSKKQFLTVLSKINLSVKSGDTIAIVGPSGSGKTTLLNIIGSLDKPTEGSVLFNNRDLTDLKDQELTSFRNQEIGFIFQLHHLLPQCTVLENVLIPTLPLEIKDHSKQTGCRTAGESRIGESSGLLPCTAFRRRIAAGSSSQSFD